MGNDLKLVQDYIGTIEKELVAGNATEHTHRPALKTLVEGLIPAVLFASISQSRYIRLSKARRHSSAQGFWLWP